MILSTSCQNSKFDPVIRLLEPTDNLPKICDSMNIACLKPMKMDFLPELSFDGASQTACDKHYKGTAQSFKLNQSLFYVSEI